MITKTVRVIRVIEEREAYDFRSAWKIAEQLRVKYPSTDYLIDIIPAKKKVELDITSSGIEREAKKYCEEANIERKFSHKRRAQLGRWVPVRAEKNES